MDLGLQRCNRSFFTLKKARAPRKTRCWDPVEILHRGGIEAVVPGGCFFSTSKSDKKKRKQRSHFKFYIFSTLPLKKKKITQKQENHHRSCRFTTCGKPKTSWHDSKFTFTTLQFLRGTDFFCWVVLSWKIFANFYVIPNWLKNKSHNQFLFIIFFDTTKG